MMVAVDRAALTMPRISILLSKVRAIATGIQMALGPGATAAAAFFQDIAAISMVGRPNKIGRAHV
jgi:hypothetical protein